MTLSTIVCSKHFVLGDFTPRKHLSGKDGFPNFKPQLNHDAIPSVFDYNEEQRKRRQVAAARRSSLVNKRRRLELKETSANMPVVLFRTPHSRLSEPRLKEPTLFGEAEQTSTDKQPAPEPRQHKMQIPNPFVYQDRAKSARRESFSLIEYSRRRFQTVIELESPPIYPTPVPSSTTPQVLHSSRPKTTGGVGGKEKRLPPPTPTNGPTRDGSLLYNTKPSLLSSIRTRPKSDTPGRFDHLRGTNAHHPDIQRTLEQSNSEYRVQTCPSHTARTTTHSEFSPSSQDFVILIPVTSHPSDDVTPEDDVSVASPETELVEKQILPASSPRSRSPKRSRPSRKVKKSGEGRTMEKGGKSKGTLNNSRNVPGRSPRATTQSSGAVPRVDLTVASSPQEKKNNADTSRLNPAMTQSADSPSSTRPQKAPAAGLLAVPGAKKRQSSAKKRSSPSSKPSSARSDASSVISTSLRNPRPPCWVDGLTISSDESLRERQLSLNPELEVKVVDNTEERGNRNQIRVPSPPPAQRGDNFTSASVDKKKVADISKRTTPTSPVKNKQASATKGRGKGGRRRKAAMEAVGDDEEGEVVMPRFLCPSSESKSRQAAIKEWLAKTSFSSACRTVPLM